VEGDARVGRRGKDCLELDGTAAESEKHLTTEDTEYTEEALGLWISLRTLCLQWLRLGAVIPVIEEDYGK
jgi:hypothetical protein